MVVVLVMKVFRTADANFRTSRREDTGAGRSAEAKSATSARSTVHFVLLQVTIQVGLLAETPLAHRTPNWPTNQPL